MKTLAEQLVERAEEVCANTKPSQDEAMSCNERIEVKLEDGHRVSLYCNFDIHKGYEHDSMSKVDDVEKQAAVKQALKADMDVFMKAAAEKLKALQQL